MKMIEHITGWFETYEIPTYDLSKITGSNDEYIDKSYARVIHLFNNTRIRRYPLIHKVVFDN